MLPKDVIQQIRRISQVTTSNPEQRKKLLLLIIPIATFGLGTWQIFRLQWKLNLIEKLETKTKKSPIDVPSDIEDRLKELEYSRVRVSGSFDHSKELHLWPRTQNKETTRGRAEPGAQIITPLYCKSLGKWILINRGWVPNRLKDPQTRPSGQVEGEVDLTAVVRTTEKKPTFSPRNDVDKNRWSYRDIEHMSAVTGTSQILLDADATTTVPGGPIGGQTRVTLRNDHLQYIFTWYALSLFTGYMFWTFWKKKSANSTAAQKLYSTPPSKRGLK